MGTAADASSCTDTQPSATNTCGATAAFPACPTACGSAESTQTRAVTCQDQDGVTAADASSCTDTQPSATNTCAATAACSYSWAAAAFPACPTACGSAESTQTRAVTCQDQDGATAADASSCTDTQPSATNMCSSTSQCDEDSSVVAETVLTVDFGSLSVGANAVDALADFKSEFVSEMAAVLGIDASRIVVLDVRAGSVVVRFEILASVDESAPSPAALLVTLQGLVDDQSSRLYSSTILSQVDSSRALAQLSTSSPAPAPAEEPPPSVLTLQEDDATVLGMNAALGFVMILVISVAVGATLFYLGWCLRGRSVASVGGMSAKLQADGEHNV